MFPRRLNLHFRKKKKKSKEEKKMKKNGLKPGLIQNGTSKSYSNFTIFATLSKARSRNSEFQQGLKCSSFIIFWGKVSLQDVISCLSFTEILFLPASFPLPTTCQLSLHYPISCASKEGMIMLFVTCSDVKSAI